jgi:phosphatidylglycerophosphate synthase
VLREGWRIYLATRKRNDLLFNHYVMRPLAGFAVALIAKTPATPNQITILNLAVFLVSAGLLVAWPTTAGALVAIAVLELSYLLDCADGMLARHRKVASQAGHLFDLFTDELKAIVLVGAIGVRSAQNGGLGPDLRPFAADHFLIATIVGVGVLASATSLTSFVRRPEITGKDTPVEAHYETVEKKRATSVPGFVAKTVFAFLRFLNHYPSHIFVWAAFGRLDLFFWMYVGINTLYLAQGWVTVLVRFGMPPR